jgi:tRNA threonylcarbamoyladenosine biosynthesis protein TsaE
MMPSVSIASRNHEETSQIGQKIGELAIQGLVIALTGDLGSGKTALIQGIAKGLHVPGGYYVTSPSYTLINEYPGRIPLIHIDLYRLSSMDFDDIGLYDILKSNIAVVAIEWAERIPTDSLPEHLSVRIDITGGDTRNISLSAHGKRPEQFLFQFES